MSSRHLRTTLRYAAAAFVAFLLAVAPTANASPHSGTTYVHGYRRQDGTYVSGYIRHYSHLSSNLTASPHPTFHSSPSIQGHDSKVCQTCQRDSRGRIARSSAAKHEFMKMTGYPNGRPGYVVDHIVPLKRGGADSPSNMQWQTIEEAKAKDRWE